MAEPRRGRAAPVVLAGVVTTGLVALAADRTWMSLSGAPETLVVPVGPQPPQVPLTFTLALVALASWGVVLVTRGRVRRAVAVLGLLAAAGSLAATVSGWWLLRDSLREQAGDAPVDVSAWYVVALVAGVLALGPALVAVRRVSGWAEMGRRYDAPTAPGTTPGEGSLTAPGSAAGADNLDLWRSLDRGDDPTL